MNNVSNPVLAIAKRISSRIPKQDLCHRSAYQTPPLWKNKQCSYPTIPLPLFRKSSKFPRKPIDFPLKPRQFHSRHLSTSSNGQDSAKARDDLPSKEEGRRSSASKRFDHLMDNIQSNIFTAGQRLNDLTGYTGIEALKKEIEQQGSPSSSCN